MQQAGLVTALQTENASLKEEMKLKLVESIDETEKELKQETPKM